MHSYGGMYVSRIFDPHVVRIPIVASTSLSARGIPATGCCGAPVPRWVSSSAARSSATSGVRVRNALHAVVHGVDPAERGLDDLGRRDLSSGDLRGELGARQVAELGRHPCPSTIRTTLNRPSSCSGALASASACGSDGSGVSSRYTLDRGIA